jgi:hypothetical protein
MILEHDVMGKDALQMSRGDFLAHLYAQYRWELPELDVPSLK